MRQAHRGAFQRPVRPRRAGWGQFLVPENLAVVAVLFWMTGPVAPLIPNLDDSLDVSLALPTNSLSGADGVDSQFLRLSWYPIYVVVLLLVHRHRHRIWEVAKQNAALLLILGWTFLSTLWSVSPSDTLRRSAALSLTTTFAVYLGIRFDTLSAIKLVALALGLDIIGSAVCGLAFPAIGVSHDAEYAGAWRGVFASKNQLGAMMLIGCLSFWVLYLAERRRLYLAGLGAAFALLILSTSKTPIFILLGLLPCLALVRRFFHNRRGFSQLLAFSLSLAALLLLLGCVMIGPILALFGRDLTFTGRTDIWDLSWAAVQQSYWLGYGYGAFWSDNSAPATSIWEALNWRVPSSHSGLLELWLGLGLVGVLIFASFLVRGFSAITSQAAQGTREECMWRIGYFVVFVVHAITEPTTLDQTSVGWALVVYAATVGTRIRTVTAAPVATPAMARSADDGLLTSAFPAIHKSLKR
ncbi:MAG TPA: O-antigen ligase family protein [Stellaceae bacterium]|nr:O-antigen ligase family protein [Stellaceae bacterium]